MWHDHPFSQRNMTTERAVVVGFGGDKEVGGRMDNICKKGVGNIGEVFIK